MPDLQIPLNTSLGIKTHDQLKSSKNLASLNLGENMKTATSSKFNKTTFSKKSKQVTEHLGFLNDHLLEKVEIKNPKVKSIIEECEGYGPYYSRCPVCNNKNLSYFKDLKTDDAVRVLNYIKKSK